ncbi:hypothetical protein GCM10017557_38620 [Streptomyces aurantiacus]|uniref:Uncharacterized protein n=1 Tax=Streptomyces aurantiacus TaxID=47760 RepID=A0A7G1NZU0_9ACTN|nr:hypothetical protein GCM10017557_38620 [Streptomyces aurantiacus]
MGAVGWWRGARWKRAALWPARASRGGREPYCLLAHGRPGSHGGKVKGIRACRQCFVFGETEYSSVGSGAVALGRPRSASGWSHCRLVALRLITSGRSVHGRWVHGRSVRGRNPVR